MRRRIIRLCLDVEVILSILAAKIIFMFFSPQVRSRFFGILFTDSPEDISQESAAKARRIKRDISIVKRRFPWFLQNCVVEAIAGKLLLSRRAIPYTLYIGFRPSPTPADRPLIGHAWVRSGETIVTGAPVHQGFKIVSYYGAKRQ